MLLLTAAAASRGSVAADEPNVGLFSPITRLSPEKGLHLLNHTFGGRQFWGDVQFFHDWRIQRNVFTGHYRLLDGQDRRHASGTLEECREKLAEIRQEKKLPAMSGKAVVLLHGIFRSAHSLKWMGGQIAGDDAIAISMDYPSTQISIPAAAEYLDSVLSNLDGIDEIHLVTHSMGGLVVRAYLAEHRDPRIRRLVMIAPPNQGAEMADLLKRNLLFRGLFGPSGQQLSTEGLIPTLPTPNIEFAIIAGARGTDTGWNLLIPGDDDGTVTVASTKLVGAADFATVPTIHTFLIGEPAVAEMARRFITEGRLKSEGDPQPLLADADPMKCPAPQK
jgi:pimeloyl-ACP methyl ester carboxylesterase